MQHHKLICSLERFGKTLPSVVGRVDADDARWRPQPGLDGKIHWSILEVVCHLADEEVEDFRTRLRLTLEDPSQRWPSIDPHGWAVQRRYNDGDLREAVDRFISERQTSIDWLKGLGEVDWTRTYTHPKVGPLRAGDLLASWAAHDALHLRQIAKRLHQMAQRDAGEYSVRYAGEW